MLTSGMNHLRGSSLCPSEDAGGETKLGFPRLHMNVNRTGWSVLQPVRGGNSEPRKTGVRLRAE